MVPRKAGWDTHGLPVELEVEKLLGLNGKEQIEEYGMEPFISGPASLRPMRWPHAIHSARPIGTTVRSGLTICLRLR